MSSCAAEAAYALDLPGARTRLIRQVRREEIARIRLMTHRHAITHVSPEERGLPTTVVPATHWELRTIPVMRTKLFVRCPKCGERDELDCAIACNGLLELPVICRCGLKSYLKLDGWEMPA